MRARNPGEGAGIGSRNEGLNCAFFCEKSGQKWNLFGSQKLAPFSTQNEFPIKVLIGGTSRPNFGGQKRSLFGTQIWPPKSIIFAKNGPSLSLNMVFFWIQNDNTCDIYGRLVASRQAMVLRVQRSLSDRFSYRKACRP